MMPDKDKFIKKHKSRLDVIDIIRCLHFDEKSFIEDQKIKVEKGKDFFYYYELFVEYGNKDKFKILNDNKEFSRRLELVFADEVLKSSINEKLESHPESFKVLYNTFSDFRSQIETDIIPSKDVETCLSGIRTNGIYKFEGMFSEKQLEEIAAFQNKTTHIIETQGAKIAAGYINIVQQKNTGVGLEISYEKENHGLLRMQSKSMGFFHPGSDTIISDKRLNQIYQLWYKNKNTKISRATMDWLTPADINHNGWHIDILSNQLKAMVLLSDVDLNNGPMYYANGSHYINNDFELKMKHATFMHGLSKNYCLGTRHGNNICAITGGNVTYISDDFVDNQPLKLDYNDIVIDGQNYNKTVATGKRGDVIFFDSCGYHSGNICQKGMRLDLVLSCPTESSYIGNFLKVLGKNL
jgi:hypothetical protein